LNDGGITLGACTIGLIASRGPSGLNAGRVKHDADAAADALGGEVAGELAPDDSVGSVGAADASPVDAELGPVLPGGRGLGDVRDALPEVEGGVLLGVAALDLDEGGVVVLVAEAALVSEDGAVDVEADGLGVLLGHFYKCMM